ncbi:Zinc finger RING-type [Arabidopsis thaliana x Arabidopsis arenosa]|uniref:RING-type E3 ubiquitin transferase n=1 Tax=Arabidopsis thaliana x Arabidopsis arenosa TaxID=1240361 RepID=A0A8T1Z1E6_9BRAS|nr:Zinc finger RING-type [Arabidopsis thaliana x Arabidopsis arenosa]
MTIFARDLIYGIEARVLLPLFLVHFLPYVTSQQESESADRNRNTNFPKESVIAIIALAIFISITTLACFLHNTFYREELEAASQEVLHSRARSGLEKELIESFPLFLYSEVKGFKIGKGGVECAICLSEFEDQETLRWMPPCSHTFHANCIDVWLSSRSTCPVCRANLSLKPSESFPYPIMDLETGNARRDVLEPTDESRFHSTGRSLLQLGKNLDRFTLQLPKEMQRRLVSLNLIRISNTALPRAMSSRQGYRSKRSGFSEGRLMPEKM